jgi:dihydrofolate reductase
VLKRPAFGNTQTVNELLKPDFIDETGISVIPILVGNMTKLFKDGRPEHDYYFLR